MLSYLKGDFKSFPIPLNWLLIKQEPASLATQYPLSCFLTVPEFIQMSMFPTKDYSAVRGPMTYKQTPAGGTPRKYP